MNKLLVLEQAFKLQAFALGIFFYKVPFSSNFVKFDQTSPFANVYFVNVVTLCVFVHNFCEIMQNLTIS
jgi:hypothetical protein